MNRSSRVASTLLAILLGLLFVLLSPGVDSASDTILITAVYNDTYLSGEPDEAFRPMNVSGSAVDLTDRTVTDGEGTITLSGTLDSAQSIWITREAASFAQEFGFAPDYEYGSDSDATVPNPTGTGIRNKMVLVLSDGKGYVHTGSINDSENSSKSNREFAVQVQSGAAYAYLSDVFWHDWGEDEEYFVHLPLVLRNYGPPSMYSWTGQVTNQFPNCGLTRVFGYTLDRDGGLAGDIWVHYWADGWDGAWAKSLWYDFGAGTPWTGDEGNWDGVIDNRARAGVWHVCVVPDEGSWDCVSNTVDVTTSSDCENGYQIYHITFQHN